jgi:hypothetical protein
MPEITIDSAKAERMMAQILRDEAGLLPSKANELAANICRRLSSAMASPTHAPLQGYRLIRDRPPHDSDFAIAVRKKIANVNGAESRELWKLVYDRALDLPATMADSSRI